MKTFKTFDFWNELIASVFTVAGIYYGTTNLSGATLYAISCVFWIIIMLRRKMWGILPLNVANVIVISHNLYKVIPWN